MDEAPLHHHERQSPDAAEAEGPAVGLSMAPASLGHRFAAAAVDGALVAACLVGLYVGLAVLGEVAARVSYGAYEAVLLLGSVGPMAVALGAVTVSVVGVGRIGQSIGKRTVGVRVQDVGTGDSIGVARALLRAVMLGLMALPCYLGFITFFTDSSGRNRAFHDNVAQDVAVSLSPVPFVQSVKDVLSSIRGVQ
jgi:uncharacterized RDD family membrane protein YckC